MLRADHMHVINKFSLKHQKKKIPLEIFQIKADNNSTTIRIHRQSPKHKKQILNWGFKPLPNKSMPSLAYIGRKKPSTN